MAEPHNMDKTTMCEMITFVIGGQEFGIDVMAVREIRVWTPATPVAHSPSFIYGVINLRGAVLPVIDFAARLGLPPSTPSTRHAILVAQVGTQPVGLLVEGVSEILSAPRTAIQPVPDLAGDFEGAPGLVDGIIALDGRMISLIALAHILPRSTRREAA